MATLTIEGQKVTIDDKFLSMSPAEQSAVVDEIGSSLGIKGSALPAPQNAPGGRGTGIAAERSLAPMGFGEAVMQNIPDGFLYNLGNEATAAAAASPLPGAGKMRTSGAPNFGPLDVGAGVARMALEKDTTAMKAATDRGAPSFGPIDLLLKGANSLFGGKEGEGGRLYESKLQDDRAQSERAMKDQMAGSIIGQVGGAMANPINRALPAATFKTGMKTGGVVGGIYGFGQGEGVGDRLYQGALGSGMGAIVGGPLGGLMPGGAPKPPNAVVEAADRLRAAGMPVNVPKFVASESMPVQRLASAERNIPIAGDKIVKSFEGMKGELGQAADDVAGKLGAASSQEAAGSTAKGSIRNFIDKRLEAVSNRLYGVVDNAIAPNANMPHALNNTQKTVSDILASNVASARPSNGAAVNEIKDAITRPGGLTYEGIKDLRSRIGSKVSDLLTPTGEKNEYRALYAALSEDLKAAAARAGGAKGLQAFERANAIHKMGMDRVANLEKIIGSSGGATGESVFSRILAMAGSKSSADIQTLVQARKAMGKDAWDEVAGTIISHMGRDTQGKFSPDRFVTAWGTKQSPNGLSDMGKNLLFSNSSAHRKALDDIVIISNKAKDMNKFSNPSGTGQTGAGIGMLTGAIVDPVTTVTLIVGNMGISHVLSTPATAASMARWARAQSALVTKPTAATMAAFQQASKNFAATIGEKLGINVNPMEFARAMQGARPGRADEQQ